MNVTSLLFIVYEKGAVVGRFFMVKVFVVELVSPSLSVIVRVIVLIPLSAYL